MKRAEIFSASKPDYRKKIVATPVYTCIFLQTRICDFFSQVNIHTTISDFQRNLRRQNPHGSLLVNATAQKFSYGELW